MLYFVLGNVFSLIEGRYPKKELSHALSFPVEGAYFIKKHKPSLRGWDGRKRLITSRGRLPTGLVPKAFDFLQDMGYRCRVVDSRRVPVRDHLRIDSSMLQGITLRGYQLDAIRECVRAKRGIVKVPTGGGKTEIAAGVIKALDFPALFLVHIRDLMWQTKERLEKRLGERVGVIGDGKYDPKPRTVAMVQSLYARLSEFETMLDYYLVIFGDELHHLSSTTWYSVFSHCHAPYRFGMSGTPNIEGKGMMLQAMTGRIIYEATSEALTEQGYLARVLVRIIPYKQSLAIPPTAPYHRVYQEGVVWNDARNLAVRDATLRLVDSGKTALVLVREIAHGEILRDLLQASTTAEFVQGKDDSEVRRQVTELLKSRDVKVVIATSIFDEGKDIPNVGAVVLAAGGKSERQLLQRIGRGMRVVKGKTEVVVLDFQDGGHKWLIRHSQERRRLYKNEGFRVVLER